MSWNITYPAGFINDKRRISVLLLVCDLDYHKIAIVRILRCALHFLFLISKTMQKKMRIAVLLLVAKFDVQRYAVLYAFKNEQPTKILYAKDEKNINRQG